GTHTVGITKSVLIAGLLAFAPALCARADDLAILSAAAVRPALIELPALFAKATGHRMTVTFGNAAAIEDKVTAGGPGDLGLPPLTRRARETDARRARRSRDGATRPARGAAGRGAAARAAGPRPAVAPPEGRRRALLAAPSSGWAAPADGSTSSTHLVKLIQE